MTPFQWASPLGASVALFLAYGLLAVGVGAMLPFLVRAAPIDAFGLFAPRPDRALFGAPPLPDETARAAGLLRALHWWWMGGTLVTMGLLQLGVVWFGLRAGQAWALPLLALADLAVLPFAFLVVRAYVAAGAAPTFLETPPLLWFPATVVPLAVVLGWIGTR